MLPPNFMSRVADYLSSHDAYVVGGAVRERLLKRPIADYDIAIPSEPSALAKSLAAKLGGTAFALDAERGISRVSFADEVHLDLVQRQGPSWEIDLDRRDFTVNALAVPLHTWLKNNWREKLVDRHGGVKDLKKKNLRAVSKTIFAEDPLRLLRAYRIAAEIGFSIEKSTRALVRKHKKLLAKSAPERVRDEMLKIFSTKNAYSALVDMETDGLLESVFPEAKTLRRCAPRYYGKGGVLKHSLDSIHCLEDVVETLSKWFPRVHKKIRAYLAEPVAGYSRLAHMKWSLLLHDLGKPATAKMMGGRLRFFEHEHVGADKVMAMAARYRWSNAEAVRHERMVRNHMRPGNLASHGEVTDKAIHRFFRDLEDDGIGMLLVSLGDHLSYLSPKQRGKKKSEHEKTTVLMVNRYYNAREKILPPKLLNGHEIMTAFKLEQSPLIGELLQAVTEAQTDGKVTTRDEALAFLSERVKKT